SARGETHVRQPRNPAIAQSPTRRGRLSGGDPIARAVVETSETSVLAVYRSPLRRGGMAGLLLLGRGRGRAPRRRDPLNRDRRRDCGSPLGPECLFAAEMPPHFPPAEVAPSSVPLRMDP